MATVEDLVTGAGFLPHVYCRKVILENSSAEGDNDSNLVNVTLQLEVYQKVSNLTESNWLNSLNILGKDIMDSMYIQVVPFTSTANIAKLKASTKPPTQNYTQNVYSANLFLEDGHLPRFSAASIGGTAGFIAQNFAYLSKDDITSKQFKRYQLSNSSLLGNISSADAIADGIANGQIREEIKYGEAYYVIPFQTTHQFDPTSSGNLGFLFYTLLDVREFMFDTGVVDSVDFNTDEILESAIIEGPVNTEIVYESGQPSTTREAFVLPDGRVWDGSVHLHASGINPDANGYAGDGTFGENKGWMTGQQHQPGADQPKLSLVLASNNKLQDFTSSAKGSLADGVLGLGQDTVVKSLNAAQNNAVSDFLSPFDKLSKKYVSKFGPLNGQSSALRPLTSGAKYYDNDSEFSKLYVNRDRDNNARGLFFIDMIQFAYNNSKLFAMLFDGVYNKPLEELPEIRMSELVENILNRSKILQLKLNRRRIQRDIIGNRPETFGNDTIYEEAPRMVGRIYDVDQYGTPNQTTGITEVDMGQQYLQRYFTFTDFEVGNYSAGLYEYSIDIEFNDGSYDYVRSLMIDLVSALRNMEVYYELSIGSYAKNVFDTRSSVAGLTTENVKFKRSSPYYQNGAFHAEFYAPNGAANKAFSGTKPWENILQQLQRLQDIFNIVNSQGKRFNLQDLFPLMEPKYGSPEGIAAVIDIADSALTTLQSILSIQKTLTSTGTELTTKSHLNEQSLNDLGLPMTSPAISTIQDSHAFYNLFEATTEDNTYIDYLSLPDQQSYYFNGLKRLNRDSFTTRVRLDVAKFSPNARGEAFNQNIADAVSFPIGTYATTAYAFLTPSIIQYAAGSKAYRYDSFSPNAVQYLSSGDTADAPNPTDQLYSEKFFDFVNNKQIYISMLNYNMNYRSTRDLDSSVQLEFPMLNSTLNQEGKKYKFLPDEDVNEDELKIREGYKNLFEDVGLQLHTVQNAKTLYGDNFIKRPGVTKAAKPTTYPLIVQEEYSDSTALTQDVYQKILYDGKQTLIEAPDMKKLKSVTDFSAIAQEALDELDLGSADYAQFIIGAPIAYKFMFGDDTQPQMAFLNQIYEQTLDGVLSGAPADNLPIILFNYGMYMKIEVYVPSITYSGDRPAAKNDESSWRSITEQDINNLVNTSKLFCRMVPVYDDALNNIFLPYIDRYFILDVNAPGGRTVLAGTALESAVAQTKDSSYGAFDQVLAKQPTTEQQKTTKQFGSVDWDKQDDQKSLGQQTTIAFSGPPQATPAPSAASSPAPAVSVSPPAAASAAPSAAPAATSTGGYSGGGGSY